MSLTKTTIELSRQDRLLGYGTFYHNGQPWQQNGRDTLDALVKWSALPENVGKQIMSHAVWERDEPKAVQSYHYAPENSSLTQEDCARLFAERLADTGSRHRFEDQNTIVHGASMVYRVPYVDKVHYLDIYHQ